MLWGYPCYAESLWNEWVYKSNNVSNRWLAVKVTNKIVINYVYKWLETVSPFGAGIIFLILAHHVYKMWIIQEPNTLELWNKLHFEEKKTESIYHV